MKQHIEQCLLSAVAALKEKGFIPSELQVSIQVDRTKDSKNGDFASNLALIIAKPCGRTPKEMASLLVEALPSSKEIEKVLVAGPGFINFYLKNEEIYAVVTNILNQKEAFGRNEMGKGERVLIEFVSANPTGPLHVGHGRGAAFGATLANILEATGYEVFREYYVNDAGRQMNILAVSVWLRYLELSGEIFEFPDNAYRGSYVFDIARHLYQEYGKKYVLKTEVIFQDLPEDGGNGGDKDIYIDALINRAKTLLTEEGFKCFHKRALDEVLEDIQDDLKEFGVTFHDWFSEQSLMDSKAISKGVEALKASGKTVVREGALWFLATEFGDEKDRVLIRANGEPTYFASDVAYHWNKYDRGFDRVIDIFGADHHGYVSRISSAVRALGHDENALNIFLVQFAILYRGNERVQMSTRSGSFVTLRELREEVGNDAARFFYVMRKPEQHMDFDLNLAKSQSNDNPVYYVQYAHARIMSVFRQLKNRGLVYDAAEGILSLGLLNNTHETTLMTLLSRYPEVIVSAAKYAEPHIVAYYLRELASALHTYYNAEPLLCEDVSLRSARLTLILAVAQVLKNALTLLGVSCPETM